MREKSRDSVALRQEGCERNREMEGKFLNRKERDRSDRENPNSKATRRCCDSDDHGEFVPDARERSDNHLENSGVYDEGSDSDSEDSDCSEYVPDTSRSLEAGTTEIKDRAVTRSLRSTQIQVESRGRNTWDFDFGRGQGESGDEGEKEHFRRMTNMNILKAVPASSVAAVVTARLVRMQIYRS